MSYTCTYGDNTIVINYIIIQSLQVVTATFFFVICQHRMDSSDLDRKCVGESVNIQVRVTYIEIVFEGKGGGGGGGSRSYFLYDGKGK